MREPSSAVVFPCANKGWSWYSNVQTPGALYALVAFFLWHFLAHDWRRRNGVRGTFSVWSFALYA